MGGGQDKPAWTACPPGVKITRAGGKISRDSLPPGGQSNRGWLAPQGASCPGGKINWDTGVRPSVRARVCACVRASTLSNMNISETGNRITIKFYLKHHWGGGKAALGFGADQIRTLVSMATDSSHRVIMEKRASSCFLGCF